MSQKTKEEIINTLRDREVILFKEYKTLCDSQGQENQTTNQVKFKWSEVWDILRSLDLKTHNHIKMDNYIKELN